MWYLIVPPVIVVTSLLFVLWYLSFKGSDPFIIRKISQLEGEETQKAFSRTKSFFLRILEKMAYRFKVRSLRMYNAFNDLTQTLKEKRKTSQERSEKNEISVKESATEEVAATSLTTEKPEVIKRTPLRRFAQAVPSHRESEVILRPMVSDQMVHPEVPYQKTSADMIREESLITHIATHPKDFSAYEELGDYYLETGNVKDAKECYRQVLKLSPAERMVKIKIRRLEKLLMQK